MVITMANMKKGRLNNQMEETNQVKIKEEEDDIVIEDIYVQDLESITEINIIKNKNILQLKGKEQLDFRTKESFKTLRANLEFSGKDVKVIAVTSCTPNEGKSSIAINLGISMAESGKKVIVVDADLRKSMLANRYQAGKIEYGLTHFLSGQKTFQDICHKTDYKRLHVVFAGPTAPNPSELLGSHYFTYLIKNLKKYYNYIIIDTPPLGSVIDSAIVAKECDGTVLVVASGEVSYKFAQKVKLQLDKSGAKVIGCVLNKINFHAKGYYGAYYNKYYTKYYGSYYGSDYGKETKG